MKDFSLTKDVWLKEDFVLFEEYLKSFSKGEEKAVWEQRIVNTKLPCLAVSSVEIDRISKEIFKGNYKSFLDEFLLNNHSEVLVFAKVLNKIKDEKVYFYYLEKYIEQVDNWSATDSLKFNIKPENLQLFMDKALKYIKSAKPFVRRVGLLILMKGFVKENTIGFVFNCLDKFENEEHYYCNMMCAWLLSECVIKCKVQAVEYLKRSKLCNFAINKGISKCRDSFRLTKEEKDSLLQYKRK